jgi:hypothetical protein
VLDHRIEDFTSDDRFAAMVLGLLSLTGTATTLAQHPRSDGGRAEPGPVTSFLLGLVAVGQRLRTTLALAEQGAPAAVTAPPAAGSPPGPPSGAGLLR